MIDLLKGRFIVAEDGCWNWIGSRTQDGYGRRKLHGEMIYAHRLSWIVHYGEIPDEMQVLHKCDNPPCVNPGHLFIGTPADNMRDKVAKGRQWHSKGPKLTVSDVQTILVDTRLHREIADEYGVSRVLVTRIKNGSSWVRVVNS